jgi:hypothetical protein
MGQMMRVWQQSISLGLRASVTAGALALMLGGGPAAAQGPGSDGGSDRASETAARAETRAQRDEIKLREDRTRTEIRAAEDRSKAETRMVEDRSRASADAAEKAAKVESRSSIDSARAGEQATRDAADAARAGARAQEEAAKASADAAIDAAKAAEDAAKDQARAAEDAAKDAEDAAEKAAKDAADAAEQAAKDAADAAEEQAKAAEDAAKDAADAAEDAAKDAADAAEDAAKDAMEASAGSRSDVSSSASLRDLGKSENPEFDRSGFPVRRGEVVALDLTPATRARAEALGFKVMSETRLRSLDSSVTRLATPAGMSASDALDALRQLDSRASFDNLHYYGLLVGVAGTADGAASQMPSRKAGALRVGMIDTAVTPHPALRGAAIEARDFSTGAGAAATVHGTAVASILANEGSSTIVAANIFKAGDGQPYTSADAIVRALEWMAERKVGVINISLAGPRNVILDALIEKVAARGQIIVAAAGNGGPSAPPAYPAAVSKVVAVTAVDKAHRVYRYANQGNYIAFAATGVGVPAAAPDGGIAGFTGTSFATPHISAELARCMKAAGKRKGGQCVERLQLAARDLGAPGRDSVYGYGLID